MVQIEPPEHWLRRIRVGGAWHVKCTANRDHLKREELRMGREAECLKLLAKRNKKVVTPFPSCRELAERFMELQKLRQKVRAAEARESPREQPAARRG
jgi:hypothetical protein